VFLGLALAFLLLAYRWFLSVWSPPSEPLWVVALPLCFHPFVVRGFYNFMASVPATLAVLTVLRLRLASRRWYYPAGFAVLCWLLFIIHPFPFFVLPLCLAVVWWLERDRVSWATIAIYAAPVLLFLGIGVLRPLLDRSQGPDAPMLFSNVLALATG